jgi:hypothetical protein
MWKKVFAPGFVGALGVLSVFHPTLLSGFRRVQTDPGDTRLNNYILEHGWRWVTGQLPGSFWDPAFYFPTKNVAAYTDVLLGSAPLYWLWRACGFLPDTSFQLWQLCVCALNFVAFYWFLRRDFAVGVAAACLGAWVFAFGGPRVAQLNHVQLYPQAFTIIALHALLRIFREIRTTPARTWWMTASLALALQLYAGFYLGWFAAYAGLIALVVALSAAQRRKQLLEVVQRDKAAIVMAGMVFVVIIAPLGIHSFAASRETGLRPLSSAFTMLPRPWSWLAADPGSWLYAWTLRVPAIAALPMIHEHALTFGVLTWLVAIGGLWTARGQRWVVLFGIVTIVTVLSVTMFPWQQTLWRIVYNVLPSASALRSVSRIALIVAIPVGIGVACTLDRLVQAGRLVPAGILAVLCALEQMHTTPSFDKLGERLRMAGIESSIPDGCAVLLLTPHQRPPARPDVLIQVDAMWAALDRHIATVNGYSGGAPAHWPLTESYLRGPADEPRLAAALARWTAARSLDPAKVCWVRTEE